MDLMRRALLLSLVIVALLIAPAGATRTRGIDRDDSPGRLDIRSAAHGHHDGELVLRTSTYERWRGSDLRGYNRWNVFFVSTNDGPNDPEGFERYIWVDYRRGKLRAVVLRSSGGMHAQPDDVVGKATVRRPNKRSVVVHFPTRLLGEDITNFRWFAETSWESRRGPCEADGFSVADNPHPFGLDGSCFDSGPVLWHDV